MNIGKDLVYPVFVGTLGIAKTQLLENQFPEYQIIHAEFNIPARVKVIFEQMGQVKMEINEDGDLVAKKIEFPNDLTEEELEYLSPFPKF
jgi:hypothetical protein